MDLEKAMAPHSSTLAWKIPWTKEPGGLPSLGSHRVGPDWSDLAAAAAAAPAKHLWQINCDYKSEVLILQQKGPTKITNPAVV